MFGFNVSGMFYIDTKSESVVFAFLCCGSDINWPFAVGMLTSKHYLNTISALFE